MKLQHMKRRVQRGFTLVELAIVLVIAGLILVAVLRGTDAIQKAQAERMVADLRGMQAVLLEFQKRNGRLPGDCDNNGVLRASLNVPTTRTLLPTWTSPDANFQILDFNPANRVMPSPPATTDSHPQIICNAAWHTVPEENINLVWNELRRAGSVDANRLPRELARHAVGDVFLVSSMRDTDALGGQWAGVIVVFGIPVWMAEAVDASIDGAATLYGPATGALVGPANTGRVRLWGGAEPNVPVINGTKVFSAAASTNSYDQGSADRDRLISISFQYTPNKLVH